MPKKRKIIEKALFFSFTLTRCDVDKFYFLNTFSKKELVSLFYFQLFFFSTDKDAASWQVEEIDSKHRSSEVTGWLCIPKSVVMATALNLKHLHRLERGKPLTILPDPRRKRRPLSEKTLAYIETQSMNRNKGKGKDFIRRCF